MAELAVNTRLAPTQEWTPYKLAMAHEPRLSLDINVEGIRAEQDIEPTERLDTSARIHNLMKPCAVTSDLRRHCLAVDQVP
ncbi:hypothetical protein EXIGLDRAFT_766372 [Exidia glandulosa HHB12029]|uniref:Uncharacterized protein n=1 Tax=Exidia glandulosa HHB12029 TaxID=1314781 RepID=A0A165JRR4_EXIGL|nr:hypothetical protein EXIGLDRAFT_766372 [Exidia glandulosa HHB12029]